MLINEQHHVVDAILWKFSFETESIFSLVVVFLA